MKKSFSALVAAGALGLALVSTTQSARAMDPLTAAAWFVGGMFVGGAVIAPAYGHSRGYSHGYSHDYSRGYSHGYSRDYRQDYQSGYRTNYAYAPVSYEWSDRRECYPATIKRRGAWRNAHVCY